MLKEEPKFIECGTIAYRHSDGSTESCPLYVKAETDQTAELAKALLKMMKGGSNEAHCND